MTKIHLLLVTVLGVIVGETSSHHGSPLRFQVSVELRENQSCIGAVFTAHWALTVASCVYNVSASDVAVRANTATPRWRGTVHMVQIVTVHPDYVPGDDFHANIALLKLHTRMRLGKQITPITLWPRVPHIGSEGFTTGWGPECIQNKENSRRSRLQKYLTTPVVILEPGHCFVIRNRTDVTCVASTTMLSDSVCPNYVGGLLVIRNKLAGLNLHTINQTLSVFSAVNYYIPWIKNIAFRPRS